MAGLLALGCLAAFFLLFEHGALDVPQALADDSWCPASVVEEATFGPAQESCLVRKEGRVERRLEYRTGGRYSRLTQVWVFIEKDGTKRLGVVLVDGNSFREGPASAALRGRQVMALRHSVGGWQLSDETVTEADRTVSHQLGALCVVFLVLNLYAYVPEARKGGQAALDVGVWRLGTNSLPLFPVVGLACALSFTDLPRWTSWLLVAGTGVLLTWAWGQFRGWGFSSVAPDISRGEPPA